MDEPRLSDFIGKGSQLVFEFPLYKKIKINTAIEEQDDQEVIFHGRDDDYENVTVLNYTHFIENKDFQYFKTLFFSEETIFHYCPSCNKEVYINYKGFDLDEKYSDSTLSTEVNINCQEYYEAAQSYAKKVFRERYDSLTNQVFNDHRTVQLVFECSSKEKHKAYTIFHLTEDGYLVKTGQYPSIANFESKIKRYLKVLKKDKNTALEFSKAVGLKANGVGVGSYVYLRRIFEKLIFDKLKEAMQLDSSINEEEFRKLKMEAKIKALKDYLPEFLVNNKILYDILSKGIHELKEEECLAHFDTVKAAIVCILEEKIEQEEKAKHKKEINRALQKIKSNL